MTTLADQAATPARDLLAAAECSPACLLASDRGACTCRCGGQYHAALLDAQVPRAAGWWDAIPGGFRPDQRDGQAPLLATPADYRAHWHGDFYAPPAFAYVRPQPGGKWAVHQTGVCAWAEIKLILQEGFFDGLVLAHRCDAASTGQDPNVYGFRTWQEAQAAAHVLIAIDWYRTDHVLPVLQELDRVLRQVPHPRLTATLTRAAEHEHQLDLHDGASRHPLTGPLMRSLYPPPASRTLTAA